MMIYRNKILFFLFHCGKNILASKSRFVLSFFGIFLSAFLFTSGTIIIDSYYNNALSKYSSYSDRTIVINNMNPKSLDNIEDKGYNIYNYSKQTNFLFRKIENKEFELNIVVNVIGTNYSFYNYLVPTFENNNLLYKPHLLEGRGFNKSDFVNPAVCIIDEFTSEVLFGKKNSIGEVVKIPVYTDIDEGDNKISRQITSYDYATVVGIIENSEYTKSNRLRLITQLNDIDKNSFYDLNVFVPSISSKSVDMSVLYSHEPIFLGDFSYMLRQNSMRGQFTTLKSITYDISKEQQEMNKTLQLVFLILLVILGFNLMNVIFFSVKERIKEIGVKKAIGASDDEVLLSFLTEGFFLGVIGVSVGMVFALFICIIGGTILKETIFPTLSITIEGTKLFFVFLISVSLSVLFSILPAWYASKIKIIDAIRFE